jgi:AcrR family transcriptional regulator
MEKLTDHRVKMTKMMLRRGLISLLETKQIKDVSVTELCRQSGINRGTFYTHFKDIDDLYRSIEDEVFEEIRKALNDYPINLVERRGSREPSIYLVVYNFFAQSSDLRSLLLNNQAYNPLIQKLLALAYDKFAPEYRLIRPGQDEEKMRLAFNFIASGFISLLKDWVEGGRRETAQTIARITEQLALACIKAWKRRWN